MTTAPSRALQYQAPQPRPGPKKGCVFSLGYHGKTLKEVAQLLMDHKVDVLIDVRTYPRSRWNPSFNRNNLARIFGESYEWAGNCLGGYDGKKQPDYDKCLKKLAARSRTERICIMCIEPNFVNCHRDSWIAKDIEDRYGITVNHL